MVLCPKCGIDAVLGDVSSIPIQKDVLEELYDVKFGYDDGLVAHCVVSGTDVCDKVMSLLDCFGIVPGQRYIAWELRVMGSTVLF